MTKLIDLSVYIEDNVSEPAPPKIKRIYHKAGAKIFSKKSIFMGKRGTITKLRSWVISLLGKGVLKPECFPDEEFLSNEIITATTHTGTHMDAPWHYGSKCQGNEARKIAEIPLDYFFGDGVVLDLSHKKPGALIEVEDIKNALNDINYQLKARDIVLIKTGMDKKWGKPEYFTSHPGMGKEATKYLVDHGIKVMGIDAYGFDRPFGRMIGDYMRTGNKGHLWPAHFYGREEEYFHMERLANLDQIPKPYGFQVACFPIKIRDVGASWVRAVAIVEE